MAGRKTKTEAIEPVEPIEGDIIETVAEAPEVVVSEAPAVTTTTIELKAGQAIVSKIDSTDDNDGFVTSIANWNNIYNKGVNQDKYKLIAEKKSSQ